MYCRKCKIPLTNDLLELPNRALISEEEGEDYIPQGFFVISDGSYFTNSANQLIINVRDMLNCANHPNPSRLNGCCGLDGTDGPNKICSNGHEVGTEKSDCWMPHAFLIEQDFPISTQE
ncbi:hypothetical protein LGH70_17670 [Hymenobacter sp. BT635]|uniref:Uncharacterized protein n=1 Tax=Hymenobacter nitidus TaxID=2880929 RepID=A0ABS8AHI4_9BACT|nr:hypothetical protein [Hymenobacter nitidus]MCB2379432.1 hypothetical protein [Hymenobacter nitidus]